MRLGKILSKVALLATCCSVGYILTACGSSGSTESVAYIEDVDFNDTVKVIRKDLTPTLSSNVEIEKSGVFTIESSAKGLFTPKVKVGEKVKKGQVIGLISGNYIKAPADTVVVSIISESEVPKNYPLCDLTYTGFSLKVNADKFLAKNSDLGLLSAKFQVEDGIGPTDCVAVVKSNDSEGTNFSCLIGKDVEVKVGETATVVIKATSRKKVLVLPLSSVAGRSKKGQVRLVENGANKIVDVSLGTSDGAYIEITSGLKEGDEVTSSAPLLDLRNSY